jgi:hypothetical protein
VDLRGAVFDRLRALPGAQEGESAFVDGPGFWAGGTEVAHLDARGDGAVVADAVAAHAPPAGAAAPPPPSGPDLDRRRRWH